MNAARSATTRCCLRPAAAPEASSSCAPAPARRRRFLASAAALLLCTPARDASAAAAVDDDLTASPFVAELLRRTEAQRDARRVERLRAYDRRNFGDYFAFQSGTTRGSLSANDAAIARWLEESAGGDEKASKSVTK